MGVFVWHAKQTVAAMDSGLLGSNFDSKAQLTNLGNGVQALSVNPKTRIVQALPIIYHIMQNAKAENFRDIIIGKGQFVGNAGLPVHNSVSPSLLKDADLQTLVPRLGCVFLDYNNHLHIQVKWV